MSPRFNTVLRRGAGPNGAARNGAARNGAARNGGAPDSMPAASNLAARLQRRWWADTRVIIGILVIAVSMIIGARVMSMGADQVQVWQVQRDISAGAVLTPEDLVAVGVAPDVARAYVATGGIPDAALVADVRAGEMLPIAAVSGGSVRDVRWVTLPIEPLHAPADLATGDRVDVWSTPDVSTAFGSEGAVRPELVLANALVAGIDVDARGFAGDYGVVIEVAPDEAQALLTAVRTGLIDLVRVPLGVQQ